MLSVDGYKSVDFSQETGVFSSDSTDNPYRATVLWRTIVEQFRKGVPTTRHWRRFRFYDNCFTGVEAVKWLHTYINSNAGVYGADLTRDNAVRLMSKLLQAGVVTHVRAKPLTRLQPPLFRHDGTLYRLTVNGTPGRSTLQLMTGAKTTGDIHASCATPTPHSTAERADNSDNCFRPATVRPATQLFRRTRHKSAPSALTSRSMRHPDGGPMIRQLADEAFEVQKIWKEQLIKCVDEVLGTCLHIPQSLIRPSWIEFNVVSVGHTGFVDVYENHSEIPGWVLLAMKCLKNWPHFTWNHTSNTSKYPDFVHDVFKVVLDYFCQAPFPLISSQLYACLCDTLHVCTTHSGSASRSLLTSQLPSAISLTTGLPTRQISGVMQGTTCVQDLLLLQSPQTSTPQKENLSLERPEVCRTQHTTTIPRPAAYPHLSSFKALPKDNCAVNRRWGGLQTNDEQLMDTHRARPCRQTDLVACGTASLCSDTALCQRESVRVTGAVTGAVTHPVTPATTSGRLYCRDARCQSMAACSLLATRHSSMSCGDLSSSENTSIDSAIGSSLPDSTAVTACSADTGGRDLSTQSASIDGLFPQRGRPGHESTLTVKRLKRRARHKQSRHSQARKQRCCYSSADGAYSVPACGLLRGAETTREAPVLQRRSIAVPVSVTCLSDITNKSHIVNSVSLHLQRPKSVANDQIFNEKSHIHEPIKSNESKQYVKSTDVPPIKLLKNQNSLDKLHPIRSPKFTPEILINRSMSRIQCRSMIPDLSFPRTRQKACQALRLLLLLMNPADRRRLQLLASFIHRVSENKHLRVCSRDMTSQTTRQNMLDKFLPCVMPPETALDAKSGGSHFLFSFIVDHQTEVLTCPPQLRERVERAIQDLV